MSTDVRTVVREATREDLVAFIERSFRLLLPKQAYHRNWHIEAIAWHLRECHERRIKRLIISMPPRNLKSICASVAFPAWVLGRNPSTRIVCVSYSNELTEKHARDCRAIMQAPWYREAFPNTVIDTGKNTVLEYATTQHGYRLGTSVGGTLTGRGGNLIIIDDPMKPQEAMSAPRRNAVQQWFDNTLYSRLDSKSNDVIIIVMQRLHVDDLIGYVLDKEEWTQLSLPAIAEAPQRIQVGHQKHYSRRIGELLNPDHEPRVALDSIRNTLGTAAFEAQYQQRPVPPGGNMIKWKWFQTYDRSLLKKRPKDRIVQSWDTAAKTGEFNDYSVCTTWLVREEEYYLVEVLRKKLEYPDLRWNVEEHATKYGLPTVLIEDSVGGTQLIQDLRRNGRVKPVPVAPIGTKEERMAIRTPVIEAGHVFLPESAPWLETFQAEVMAFPNCTHDDQVDSMCQFLTWREVRKKKIGRVYDWSDLPLRGRDE
nr:phage terminase large subunit [Nitrosomonas nitrosa]